MFKTGRDQIACHFESGFETPRIIGVITEPLTASHRIQKTEKKQRRSIRHEDARPPSRICSRQDIPDEERLLPSQGERGETPSRPMPVRKIQRRRSMRSRPCTPQIPELLPSMPRALSIEQFHAIFRQSLLDFRNVRAVSRLHGT